MSTKTNAGFPEPVWEDGDGGAAALWYGAKLSGGL